MPRYKIDLDFDFGEIRERIERDFRGKYNQVEWANNVKVTQGLVSNVHKKDKNKRSNPSLEYVIAVARFTGKPVEWYLYGTPAEQEKQQEVVKADLDSERPEFCGTEWTEEDILYCKQLKRILDSKHPVIIPMLVSNLAAFEHLVNEEKKKSRKVKNLEKRIEYLEALNEKELNTGSEGAE